LVLFWVIELPKHLGEAVRNARTDDVVVHRPELLPDLALHVST